MSILIRRASEIPAGAGFGTIRAVQYLLPHGKYGGGDRPKLSGGTQDTGANQNPENEGYYFEAADAPELPIRKELGLYKSFFELVAYRVTVDQHGLGAPWSEATVRVKVGDNDFMAGDGEGPVNAR